MDVTIAMVVATS